jgi:hypothetical protein
LEIKEEGFGKFHGNISLDIPKDNPRLTRSGYAGIRSKVIILYFSSVAYNLNTLCSFDLSCRFDHHYLGQDAGILHYFAI